METTSCYCKSRSYIIQGLTCLPISLQLNAEPDGLKFPGKKRYRRRMLPLTRNLSLQGKAKGKTKLTDVQKIGMHNFSLHRIYYLIVNVCVCV